MSPPPRTTARRSGTPPDVGFCALLRLVRTSSTVTQRPWRAAARPAARERVRRVDLAAGTREVRVAAPVQPEQRRLRLVRRHDVSRRRRPRDQLVDRGPHVPAGLVDRVEEHGQGQCPAAGTDELRARDVFGPRRRRAAPLGGLDHVQRVRVVVERAAGSCCRGHQLGAAHGADERIAGHDAARTVKPVCASLQRLGRGQRRRRQQARPGVLQRPRAGQLPAGDLAPSPSYAAIVASWRSAAGVVAREPCGDRRAVPVDRPDHPDVGVLEPLRQPVHEAALAALAELLDLRTRRTGRRTWVKRSIVKVPIVTEKRRASAGSRGSLAAMSVPSGPVARPASSVSAAPLRPTDEEEQRARRWIHGALRAGFPGHRRHHWSASAPERSRSTSSACRTWSAHVLGRHGGRSGLRRRSTGAAGPARVPRRRR